MPHRRNVVNCIPIVIDKILQYATINEVDPNIFILA